MDVFSFGYLLWHILLWKNEEELYPNIANTAQLIDLVCVRHELPPMADLPSPLQDLIHECLAYNDTERPTFNHIIQALNGAMLEAAIPNGDKLARKFWMHFFASKSGTLQESVPTIIFLEKFLRFTSVSSRDPFTEVAKDFFDPEGKGAVTLEHFGRIISLFGPLCEESGPEELSSPSLGRSKTPTSGRSSPVKVRLFLRFSFLFFPFLSGGGQGPGAQEEHARLLAHLPGHGRDAPRALVLRRRCDGEGDGDAAHRPSRQLPRPLLQQSQGCVLGVAFFLFSLFFSLQRRRASV